MLAHKLLISFLNHIVWFMDALELSFLWGEIKQKMDLWFIKGITRDHDWVAE